MSEPLAGSAWTAPATVEGFSQSPPNATLMAFAARVLTGPGRRRALDIGCGAARNAVHLARQGWHVLGTDLSMPMLVAAQARAAGEAPTSRLIVAQAPMDVLPARDHSFDLVVAHGIWNLARSGREFRAAVAEAARVSTRGSALFVFTFSRNTLSPTAAPVPGEAFVFTEFSGQPQCFLTREQLLAELGQVGFTLDESVPFTEHNLPAANAIHAMRTPVIFEAAFRYAGDLQ